MSGRRPETPSVVVADTGSCRVTDRVASARVKKNFETVHVGTPVFFSLFGVTVLIIVVHQECFHGLSGPTCTSSIDNFARSHVKFGWMTPSVGRFVRSFVGLHGRRRSQKSLLSLSNGTDHRVSRRTYDARFDGLFSGRKWNLSGIFLMVLMEPSRVFQTSWSCLHCGFAADFFQSRSLILERTIHDQRRSTQASSSSQVHVLSALR